MRYTFQIMPTLLKRNNTMTPRTVTYPGIQKNKHRACLTTVISQQWWRSTHQTDIKTRCQSGPI